MVFWPSWLLAQGPVTLAIPQCAPSNFMEDPSPRLKHPTLALDKLVQVNISTFLRRCMQRRAVRNVGRQGQRWGTLCARRPLLFFDKSRRLPDMLVGSWRPSGHLGTMWRALLSLSKQQSSPVRRGMGGTPGSRLATDGNQMSSWQQTIMTTHTLWQYPYPTMTGDRPYDTWTINWREIWTWHGTPASCQPYLTFSRHCLHVDFTDCYGCYKRETKHNIMFGWALVGLPH